MFPRVQYVLVKTNDRNDVCRVLVVNIMVYCKTDDVGYNAGKYCMINFFYYFLFYEFSLHKKYALTSHFHKLYHTKKIVKNERGRETDGCYD